MFLTHSTKLESSSPHISILTYLFLLFKTLLIERLESFSLIDALLSYFFFPLAKAISILIKFLFIYTDNGTMVRPFCVLAPLNFSICFLCNNNFLSLIGSYASVLESNLYSATWQPTSLNFETNN